MVYCLSSIPKLLTYKLWVDVMRWMEIIGWMHLISVLTTLSYNQNLVINS